MGGFACEFDDVFIFLLLERCIFDWSFDQSDLRMGEIILVITSFGFCFFIFVVKGDELGRYFPHIFAAYLINIRFNYSST